MATRKVEKIQRKIRRKKVVGRNSLQNNFTLAKLLSNLKNEKEQFRRKFLFVGYLIDKLAKLGVNAYLVGGEAVEIYTAGQFSTGDIDITTSNQTATIKLLRALGFTRTGMIWLSVDLGIAVQIVTSLKSSRKSSDTFDRWVPG